MISKIFIYDIKFVKPVFFILLGAYAFFNF